MFLENITNYLAHVSPLTYLVVFAGGIVTSFTPCVYPLIPIIVGVIGANKETSKKRNFILSLIYVFGMAITFAVLGVFAAITGRMFGQIQSSAIAHLIVGNVIILFALAFLDVFPLPTFLLNKAGAGKVVKGGSYFSVFLMGLASGFVAAPCTVAIMGALLTYVATTQDMVIGFSLLLTFAMGLGALLIIVGTFTGILKNIQKSEKVMIFMQKALAIFMILVGEYFVFKAGFLSL